ncbi:hypothetical protein KBC79_06040 [Candidatus Woesebacteria bacterium]|nr:hypothetical protein [Candidatus Woesebacteria bacterium]
MMVVLPTIPLFLRQHFPRVRAQLLGGIEYEAVVLDSAFAELTTAKSNTLIRTLIKLLLSGLLVLSLSVGLALVLPALYYAVVPADVVEVVPQEAGTAFGGSFEQGAAPVVEELLYEPPFDANLPEGDWIIIPRIGVRTQLQATPEAEEALQTGVWMVPDFGQPGDREVPLIAAAHRYGWQWWWKTDYWKYHSFYLLPETEPGDRVEVVSGQRKWIYEIYAGEEGDEITDYSADMILYTCKFLKSPVRHFRYARLIDPTVDTQDTNNAPHLEETMPSQESGHVEV